EIVVGYDGDDDTALVTASHFESVATIVEFSRLTPTHAVAPLTLCRRIPRGQTNRLLRQPDQVRGEDHAPRMPSPVLRIQGCVMAREQGIDAVTEEPFH